MDGQKQQAAERIKQANNILVTVSNNPSVDQLAACIGLTLTLNKMGKHATAVYSGGTPSTIEFLQPEKTLEKNTDSLRDFIIALDKSKADKLRYKVEDRVVKIFITPYRTSINEKDLEFSQGDFNVDVVLALGVHNQAELDQAITSHGRILHDATVVTVNIKPGGELGSINWLDPNASSLSELALQLVDTLDKKLVDGQIATSFLTGIVAETERFSNSKTSPQTMSASAELMAAGANQQLVATKLEEPAPPPPPPPAPTPEEPAEPEEEPEAKKTDDGTLEISHDEKPAEEKREESPTPEEPPKEEEHREDVPKDEPQAEEKHDEKTPEPIAKPAEEHFEPEAPEEHLPEPTPPQIHIDEHGALSPFEDALPPKPSNADIPSISHHSEAPKMVLQPPTLGGQLTAAATPGFGEPQEQGGLPQLEEPSLLPPPPIIKDHTMPMSQTIRPDTQAPSNEDDEMPSGGAAPADSFIVGSNPTFTPVEPTPAPESKPDAGTLEPKPTLPETPGDGRTLADIEKDVSSPHISESETPAASNQAPAPSGSMLPPISAVEPMPQTTPAPAPEPSAPAPVTMPQLDGNDMPVFANTPVLQPTPGDSSNGNPLQTASDAASTNVDSARDAVAQAIGGSDTASLDPIQALNAQPLGSPNDQPQQQADAPVQPWMPPAPEIPVIEPTANPNPASIPQITVSPSGSLQMPGMEQPNQAQGSGPTDPNAPPPGPPPMMPPTNPY